MSREISIIPSLKPDDMRWYRSGEVYFSIDRELSDLYKREVPLPEYTPADFIGEYKGDFFDHTGFFSALNSPIASFKTNVGDLREEIGNKDTPDLTSSVGTLTESLLSHYGQLHEDVAINGVKGVVSTIQRMKALSHWIGSENIKRLVERGVLPNEFDMSEQVNHLQKALLVDFENAANDLTGSEYSFFVSDRGGEAYTPSPMVDSDDLDKIGKLAKLSGELRDIRMRLDGDIV